MEGLLRLYATQGWSDPIYLGFPGAKHRDWKVKQTLLLGFWGWGEVFIMAEKIIVDKDEFWR